MKFLLKLTPEFLLCGYILLFIFFKNPDVAWDRPINSDGKGYYAYLPAIFIYHDLDYKFVESYEGKYYPSDRSVFKEFRIKVDGKIINKCFPGLAILWLPFFLVAHLLSSWLGFPTDGYSLLYQYAISIAALIYLWLGCRFLMKLLQRFGASLPTSAFITFLIAAGTNIMYYTIVENSMSHVYSFSIITLLLYSAYRYFQQKEGKYFILSTLLFALTVMIRPTNIIILLILPLLAQFSTVNYEKRNKTTWYFLSGVFLMLLLFSLQLILWHHKTGQWIVYQYGEEHFNFLHPHIPGILFSFNRGWFLYTPVAFVSMFGFIGLWKENRKAFYWMLAFFVIFIYVASSWWMWYYASKCGQRIFIDIYAVVAILFFYLFKIIGNKKSIFYPLSSILLLLVVFNVFQNYQHSRFIFPATDITKEIYRDSFFRLHPAAKVYLPEDAVIQRKSFFTDMEKTNGWENLNTLRPRMAVSPEHSSFIAFKHPYSVGRYDELDPLFTSANRIVQVTACVYSPDSVSGSSLVIEFNAGEQKLSYNAFFLSPFVQPDQWTEVEAAFYVPRDLPLKSIAKVYFFNNKGSAPLFIDNMKIEYISLKDEVQYSRIEGIRLPER
ncbi:MAG: hypothetical protein NTU98_12250 [Bacteroidetes bacterium]|nr:hypothetical protein [Bacteroidota bacterium]